MVNYSNWQGYIDVDEKDANKRPTLDQFKAKTGIIGASLLAFSLSFDDYIVTAFNAGSVVTFPISVWGQARIGLPPQYNVVGALMFFIALAVVIVGQALSGRRAKAWSGVPLTRWPGRSP